MLKKKTIQTIVWDNSYDNSLRSFAAALLKTDDFYSVLRMAKNNH